MEADLEATTSEVAREEVQTEVETRFQGSERGQESSSKAEVRLNFHHVRVKVGKHLAQVQKVLASKG